MKQKPYNQIAWLNSRRTRSMLNCFNSLSFVYENYQMSHYGCLTVSSFVVCKNFVHWDALTMFSFKM